MFQHGRAGRDLARRRPPPEKRPGVPQEFDISNRGGAAGRLRPHPPPTCRESHAARPAPLPRRVILNGSVFLHSGMGFETFQLSAPSRPALERIASFSYPGPTTGTQCVGPGTDTGRETL